MSEIDTVREGTWRPVQSIAAARVAFTGTVFLGSFLLFFIEPMFARMILPVFGGAPSVWNVALVFYQVLLLAGYLYTHSLSKLPVRTQMIVHGTILGIAAATLPVSMSGAPANAVESSPTLAMLLLLATSIGPVFFALSAQAPLMQSWFARTHHPMAANPYFLYVASNIGSMLALLAYPFLVEPVIGLTVQAIVWSAGFVVLAAFTAACAVVVAKAGPVSTFVAEPFRATVTSWRQRTDWILLAAVPSGLLLSTTTHLTTDVMAMPLLWVLPLVLYLLTFVLAFGDGSAAITQHARRIAPYGLLMMAWQGFLPFAGIPLLSVAVHLAGMFYVALAIHGRLAASKPDAGRLTEFYLYLSLGGALGGIFCALVAPVIFDWPYEHPILLLAAALLIRGQSMVPGARYFSDLRRALGLLGVALIAALLAFGTAGDQPNIVARGMIALVAACAVEVTPFFALCVALLMLVSGGWVTLRAADVDLRARSFFGTYYVRTDQVAKSRTFVHGTTVHGVESLEPSKYRDATTYYGPGSGVGQVLEHAPTLVGNAARIGIIGLGTGTLACYKRAGQRWTAYEIDPLVVQIATNPRLFHYVRDCAPDMRIAIGDGRLLVKRAPPASFDILAVDAFSSDAIPVHLMTVEAFQQYGRVLSPEGLLLVHISNRHLDLEPVVSAIAKATGWHALIRRNDRSRVVPLQSPSEWIMLARSANRLNEAALTSGVGWSGLQERTDFHAWTDERASVVPVLKW